MIDIKTWQQHAQSDDTKQLATVYMQQEIADLRAALAARATPAPAQTAVEKMLEINQLDELGHEVARLQRALCFWLPSVTDREDDVADRILQDAFLLCGVDGNIPDDFKTAQELGWVTLAPAQPTSDLSARILALPLPQTENTIKVGMFEVRAWTKSHLCDLLQAAADLAATVAAVQGQQWLPIESAPKDGTHILAWWEGAVHTIWWLDNTHTRTPWAGWKVPSLQVMPVGSKPSHWMPLPAAPAQSGGGEHV